MIRRRLLHSSNLSPKPNGRRGAVLLWFIVALPVLLTLLCVVLEVSNLYLARAELQNALEAASQAAVKDWAENGNISQARQVGNAYATANTINGVPVDLSTVDDNAFPLNQNNANSPNQNNSNDGVFVFGAITNDSTEFVFDCCTIPQECSGGGSGFTNAFAVRAQATYPVPSVCCDLFGLPIGPFTVTARADALYDCETETPRLYHLEQSNFSCSNPACP